MFSSDIYSHPEKHLCDHMMRVADGCVKKFKADQTQFDRFFNGSHWENLIWIMGFLHDFGKATCYFQEYLAEQDEKKKMALKGSPLTSHGLFSAVIAHIFVSRYIEKHSEENDLWLMMPLFIFLCIKKHHGNLNNAVRMQGSNDDNELDTADYSHLDEQFQACAEHEISHLLNMAAKKINQDIFSAELPLSLNEYFKKSIMRTERKRLTELSKKTEYYFVFQYLFSLLLHSDKEEAIFSGETCFGRTEIDADVVRSYIAKTFGQPESVMDLIRSGIFNDAEKSIMEVDIVRNHFFSLNVPTGTGKTFTSLSTALKLRKRLEDQDQSQTPRIIYALPFTSIIDQNFEVFRTVLSDPASSVLLKHHHLADICYTSKLGEFETGESKFLIESWESEIVVTTMFQVFHTIFSNRNKMIQKFRIFANAIVLLDEVQSLPYKYWIIARKAMQCLAALFNTRFILITATQPKIFEGHEIVELVPDKQKYFSQLDRVTITFQEAPVGLSDFTKLCCGAVQADKESYLFVMNTVNSALTLFETLYKQKGDGDYFFLSTNIIPAHRLQRIRDIKTSRHKKVIVSTQMIEAGVDIDIENVWRDSGPLESINQVCGRCNRNFLNGQKGRVRLFQVLDENNKNTPFAKYIYGKNALSMTETKMIISEHSEISETGFLNNMDRYYEQIRLKHRPDDSNQVQAAMDNLQFLSLYDSFRLIDEENYARKDVFIEYDANAENVWNRFMDIRRISDRLKRNEAFLKIRKDFYDYVISVPAKFVSESEYEGTHVVYMNKHKLPTCYDTMTGWIRESGGMYVF